MDNVTLRASRILLLVLCGVASFTMAHAQLSGSYTIDPNGSGSTNYTTFRAAISALKSNGVSGAVTFTVSADTFREKVNLTGPIKGLSKTNSIVFDGAGADKTAIYYSTQDQTLNVDSIKHVTLKEMTIDDPNTAGTSVRFGDGADSVTIMDANLKTANAGGYNYNVWITGGSNVTLKNCDIDGGYYGVFMNSNSWGNYKSGNKVLNCNIHNTGYYSFYVYYQRDYVLSGNTAMGANLMLNYCNNGEIRGNKFLNSTYYGIYLYDIDNTSRQSGDTTWIVNNMVSVNNADYGYPMFAFYAPYTMWYNNSFHMDGSQGYAMYAYYCQNGHFVNNSVSAPNMSGNYYAMYLYSVFSKFDYNNFYVINPGGQYFAYFNNFYTDWASFKNASSSYNQNSKFGDPEYIDPIKNLHSEGVQLNNWGLKTSWVKEDIDGDSRPISPDKTPDVGADEYYVAPQDLDLKEITGPLVVKMGNNTVSVLYKNAGSLDLIEDTVTFAWAVDGGSWNTQQFIIDTLKVSESDTFTFSTQWNVSVNKSYQLCVKLDPTVRKDPDTKDELCITTCLGKSGKFVIDRAGNGDYKSITDAIADLKCGIIGPVSFTIKSGTYNENIVLREINGVSPKNTITFEGVSKDSVTVNTTSNPGLLIDAVSYVTFREMKITVQSGSAGVKVNSGSNNVTIEKINLVGNTRSYSASAWGFDVSSSGTSNITINENSITDFFGAVRGGGDGLVITANDIKGMYYYGMDIRDANRPVITDNSIHSFNYSWAYGFYFQNNNGTQFRRNSVMDVGYMGFYINYENYNVQDTSYYVNNMLVGNYQQTWAYGFYSWYSNNLRLWHNNMTFSQGEYMMFFYYGNGFDFRNNIFANTGGNYLLYAWYTSWDYLDYNNYSNSSSTMVYLDGSSYSNLADWQSGKSQYNEHSWSQNPNFISGTDLHLSSSTPPLMGTPLGITIDKDKDSRCLFAPSLGADESNYPVPPPSTNFLVDDTVCLGSPVTVFNSASKNDAAFHSWYLNDTFITNDVHFTYTFDATMSGQQVIKLVTINCGGIDSTIDTIIVASPSSTPSADFIAEATEVEVFKDVQFSDLSSGCPGEWDWNVEPKWDLSFGFPTPTYYFSNNSDSSSQNPVIQFLFPGKYSVCLTVSNLNGKGADSTMCKSNYIIVKEQAQMCGFPNTTSNPSGVLYDDGGPGGNYGPGHTGVNLCYFLLDLCSPEITLNFTSFDVINGDNVRIYDGRDNSGQPLWDIANSPKGFSGKLSDPGFRKTFVAKSGRMYIEFETDNNWNSEGPGFAAEWSSSAGNFPAPIASFDVSDTVCKDVQIYFESTTAGNFNDVFWDFDGDTVIDQAGQTGKWTYSSNGTYNVMMVVGSCGGMDTTWKQITVVDPVAPMADFSASNLKPEIGSPVVFTDESYLCVDKWMWSFSNPSKVLFLDKTDSSSRSPVVAFNSPGCYDVTLIVSNSAGSDTLTRKCYINAITYCKPGVVNLNSDIGISRVVLGEIDNRSEIGVDPYTNYTFSHSATLERGKTYSITLERKTTGNSMTRMVWIDYNLDGDFSDAGELVASENASNTQTWTAQFTVPASASEGTSRLRVGTNLAGYKNLACGPNRFGEYEDYGLKIIPDITAPEITVPGGDTLFFEACMPLVDTGATAFDILDGNLTSSIVVSHNIDANTPGSYLIKYNVSDAAGNAAMEKTRVIVIQKDVTAPTITISGSNPSSVAVFNSYTDAGATAVDECTDTLNIVTINNVDVNVVGAYTVVYQVSDKNGNQATATRTVNVIDTVPPTIGLTTPATIYLEVFAPWTPPAVDTSDNYYKNMVVDIEDNVDNTKLGTYTVVYSVTDGSGNGPVSVTLTVIVRDTEAPVLTLNGADTLILEVNRRFVDPGVSKVDNYYGQKDLTMITSGSYYSQFPTSTYPVSMPTELGVYSIDYIVNDPSGNADTVERIVQVVDKTAPVIMMTDTLLLDQWTRYTHQGVTIYDNYNDSADLEIDYDSNGFMYWVPGEYEVYYFIKDQSRNLTYATRVLIISETGIAENHPEKYFRVFPNPNTGNFLVDFELNEISKVKVSVVNALGKEILVLGQGMMDKGTYEVNLNEAAGLYLVRIQTNDQLIIRQVLIAR